MADKKVSIMFEGLAQDCTVTTDRNGEMLCEAPDGRFVKFPSGSDLNAMVEAHNEVNGSEVEIIPDVTYGEVTTFDKDGNPVK